MTETAKRIKAKLSSLKRSRTFVPWGESASFARYLAALLNDIQAGVDDPKTGAELLAAFYETDSGVLGHCDDSSGHVGDIFRYHARDLFVAYASQCDDKEWLAKLVQKLSGKDDYGVRDSVVDCAADYLPEPVMRKMIGHFQTSADREPDEYLKRHLFFLVESLARQLKDAPLFEKTRLTAFGGPSTSSCIDIAQVYLEAGDPDKALSWLDRIPAKETFVADKKYRLLLEIYGRLGQPEKQAETAWRIFRSSRSDMTLATLIEVIGEKEREKVIAGETEVILREEKLTYPEASFLISVGRLDEAESYLLARADQLNGDFYFHLLPLAEAMEQDNRMLAASVIYRALLESLLRRAISKYYPHAVRYLKKLDKLSGWVTDWKNFLSHEDYKAELRKVHGRKTSFWERYKK